VAKQIIEALLVLEKLPPQAAARQLGLQALAGNQPRTAVKPVLAGKPRSDPTPATAPARTGRD